MNFDGDVNPQSPQLDVEGKVDEQRTQAEKNARSKQSEFKSSSKK